MPARDLVFFSYRHDKDGERWLGALQGMLEPYVLARHVLAWSDRDIRTGEQWHTRIQGALDRTRVAVLLVNHSFFGSAYIREHEVPRLVADARAGRLALIVVIVGAVDPSLLAGCGLADFQAANDPKRPIRSLRGHQLDTMLVSIAMKVRSAYGDAAADDAGPTPAAPLRHGDAPSAPGTDSELGALFDVPDYDATRYVARPDDIAALRRVLAEGSELALGVTSDAKGLGLHGMGGMGKSILATALCHDEALRRAFPDGIAWVALGQTPDLLAAQNRLLRWADSQGQPAETQAEAGRRLRALLRERRSLVVVDDVWDTRHVAALDIVGGRSRLLMTTRDATVVSMSGAQAYSLQRLPDTLARELLALRAGCTAAALPAEADEVIRHTGALPLALALAGAQVADGLSWATLVDELRQGHADFLDHSYSSVYASLGRSVDALDAQERERYIDLAVFAEDEAIPIAVVARLWQQRARLSPAQAEKLLVRLDRKALLTLAGSGDGRTMALHDLQLDFVRWRCADLAALHRALLDGYRPPVELVAESRSPWSHLPSSTPYLWPRLAAHLVAAGLDDELDQALLDFHWLKARVALATTGANGDFVTNIAAVLSDLKLGASNSVDVSLVMRSLHTSAHRLVTHPQGLAQHLHGRLGSAGRSAGDLAVTALQSFNTSSAWTLMRPSLAPPGPTLAIFPHDSSLNGALLLPNGRSALSWCHDCTLRLWDLEGTSELQVLRGHQRDVNGALLLPDGRRALSWSDDRTLRLWDLDCRSEPRVLAGHKYSVNGALLLLDGRRVLSWSTDLTLRLWELDRLSELRVFIGHRSSITGALLLPDGRRALSWSRDGTLRLWNLEGSSEPRVFVGHRNWVNGALLLPDGRALSWSRDGTLRLWDLEGTSEPRVLAGHKNSVRGALLLPDSSQALSWSRDGTLRLWDLEGTSEPRVLAGHRNSVRGALLLPGSRHALSWSTDCTLRLWDLVSTSASHVLAGHEGLVQGALTLSNGSRALSWSTDRTLRLWDLEGTFEPRVFAGHDDSVDSALLLPDGRRALSWSDDRTLRLWDLEASLEPQVLAKHATSVNGALLLPDGCTSLSWSGDHTLRFWDMQIDAELRVLVGHEDSVDGAMLVPNGRHALSWSSDNTLRLWNLDGTSESRVLVGHKGSANGALALPDGRHALSWSRDGTLRLWDLDGTSGLRVFAGHEDSVHGALLLPGGSRALSWSADGTLRLWQLEGTSEPLALIGHKTWVNGALLLPDGHRALSWSADRTLRLWELEGTSESRVFEGHGAWVNGALLLPCGRALSWSRGSTLRLWDLEGTSESRVFAGHEDSVNGALLLQDGCRALSWSNDRTLRLWHLQGNAEPRVLAGHEDSVNGALLLPDGRRALSWSNDRTLRLWDLYGGMPLARYDADAVITAVAVTPTPPYRIFVGDALGYIQILTLKS